MDKTKTAARADGDPWWVRIQHDDVQVLRQRERPDDEAGDGDRKILVVGPFFDEGKAKALADRKVKGTLAYQASNRGGR